MTTLKSSTILLILFFCMGAINAQEQIDIEVDATGTDRFVLRAANTNSGGFSALATRFLSGQGSNIGEGNITAFARNYNALPGYAGFFDLDGLDNGLNLRASNPSGSIRFMTGGSSVSANTRFLINNVGNVGVGTQFPVSKLQVSGGVLYMSDPSSQVILRSSNGSCWSVSVSNTGTLSSTSTPCP